MKKICKDIKKNHDVFVKHYCPGLFFLKVGQTSKSRPQIRNFLPRNAHTEYDSPVTHSFISKVKFLEIWVQCYKIKDERSYHKEFIYKISSPTLNILRYIA